MLYSNPTTFFYPHSYSQNFYLLNIENRQNATYDHQISTSKLTSDLQANMPTSDKIYGNFSNEDFEPLSYSFLKNNFSKKKNICENS